MLLFKYTDEFGGGYIIAETWEEAVKELREAGVGLESISFMSDTVFYVAPKWAAKVVAE